MILAPRPALTALTLAALAFAQMAGAVTISIPGVVEIEVREPELPVPPIGLPADPCRGGRPLAGAVGGVFEYGDAPDDSKGTGGMGTGYLGGGALTGKFPTLAATSHSAHGRPGARHAIEDVAWLGNQTLYPAGYGGWRVPGDVDGSLEADADAMPDEDGRPNFFGASADHDRHDGGLRAVLLQAGGVGTIDVRVTARDTIQKWYVNVLVDWDYNGRWASAAGLPPEWIVQNFAVSVPAGETRSFTPPAFAVGILAGSPWVRVTLSPVPVPPAIYATGWDGEVPPGVADPFGRAAFACGETEDSCSFLSVGSPLGGGAAPRISCDPPAASPGPGNEGEPKKRQCVKGTPWAAVTAVSAGPTTGTWMASPHTGSMGWGLPHTDIQRYGLTVTVDWCYVEVGHLHLIKTMSPPGTSPPGFRETAGSYGGCTTGSANYLFPYITQSGHPIDAGDYDLETPYIWMCPNSPGSGSAVGYASLVVY